MPIFYEHPKIEYRIGLDTVVMGSGVITLYRGRTPVKNVPQEVSVDELVALIKSDGRWTDPPEGQTISASPFAKELAVIA